MKNYFYLLVSYCCLSFFVTSNCLAQDVVTILEADGPGDTYSLISSVLAPGNNPIEAPGETGGNGCDNHSSFGEHISEVFDNDLNKNVFQFDIHLDEDNDRCRNFDRQRNEIKTYGPSPLYLKAQQGELVSYNWKFKLAVDFQPSNNFTHIFQLKASGGTDDGKPLLTLTPRRGSNSGDMELIYNGTTGNGPVDVKFVDNNELSDFLGKWLEVTCLIYMNGDSDEIAANANGIYTDFQTPGSLEFEIKEVSTGNVLMSYSNQDLDFDRNGFAFNRPKWGLYRGLSTSQFLRDESAYFADFVITEKDQSLLNTPEFELDGSNAFYPNPVSDVLVINSKIKNAEFRLYDITGKNIMTTKESRLDLSNLQKGLYMLTASNETNFSSFKVQKN